MFKKIGVVFVVLTILTGLLSACGGSSSAADSNAKKLLADLNTKARAFYNQPGWVHVTEKVVYDTDKQDRGTLSNGQVVPLAQTVDIWYHINEQKQVYQYVWIMTSRDGQTVEVTVFLNNTIYNLMTNISNPLNPYSLTLDFQFADEMDYFISSSGNHPVVTNVELDGKTATVFTLNQKLATPKTTDDYTQPINALGSIAYFDSESGLLLKLERTVTLADGSKRTFYTDTVTIETGVEPTLEVQDYVNGFW
jgi:hypothetical protein